MRCRPSTRAQAAFKQGLQAKKNRRTAGRALRRRVGNAVWIGSERRGEIRQNARTGQGEGKRSDEEQTITMQPDHKAKPGETAGFDVKSGRHLRPPVREIVVYSDYTRRH